MYFGTEDIWINEYQKWCFYHEHLKKNSNEKKKEFEFSLCSNQKKTLRENCPYTELFLVRIFLYSDWIKENTNQK